ncbi:MAG: hemerythrin domain-containing protein [Duganella sp.]
MRTMSHADDALPKPIPTETDPQDAVTLLTEDHEHVRMLFDQYEELGPRAHLSKQKLALHIGEELTRHAAIEEEVFYPALRRVAKGNAAIIDQAGSRHAATRSTIGRLQTMEATDPLFDATVGILSGQVRQHAEETQRDIFPLARNAKLDLMELGMAMTRRREETE